MASALQRVTNGAKAFVLQSNQDTDYYFRYQIIETAKRIGYFANRNEYRSWVALKMYWLRSGQLVFAIHGIGKPFNGSLICASFLEFKDPDGEGSTRATLVPIDDKGTSKNRAKPSGELPSHHKAVSCRGIARRPASFPIRGKRRFFEVPTKGSSSSTMRIKQELCPGSNRGLRLCLRLR